MKNILKSLLLGSLVVFSLSNCKKDDETKTNPTPVVTAETKVVPTKTKPGAKPSIASIKAGDKKSTKVTAPTASTKSVNKTGTKPTFSAPVSGDKSTKLVSGNSFARVNANQDESVDGWYVTKVSFSSGQESIVLFAENPSERDDDFDGTPNADDDDDDNDGISDSEDDDDDNDGILDSKEADGDSDDDGINDSEDLDDDGDGTADIDEVEVVDNDIDDDGVTNDMEDEDGDGTVNKDDTDDDGDGTSDTEEDDYVDPSYEQLGAEIEKAFDFVLFFNQDGEYLVYDPSEKEDAWDLGYWYLALGVEGSDYLAFDLGDAEDEGVFEIDGVTDSAVMLSSYDADEDLEIKIDFKTFTI
jgi:hypothetical protein